ncbi:hypothetical protein B0H15DRAFT_854976 [Mycena belliarum]|uniref:F-box domain-containing protein n=1 Tax=Mycena belliarum TaxID=1033014 RepID=A0AAD6TX86_9AGAR|nr:hypothetical protein B0H15DRAFT_854976 [Mycena belliae]
MNSPFSDFLVGNPGRVPSSQEAISINEILAQAAAQLVLLNSRMPRRTSGRKPPRKLRTEIDLARRFIKFHKALLAPWRLLPAEIMSEIFVFVLHPVDVDSGPTAWNDSRAQTLLLTKVCRRWRNIALSTPSLWTTLSLLLNNSPAPYEWVPLWLDRARSLPIHLQVLWHGATSASALQSLLSTVADRIQHIRTLLINGLDGTIQIIPDHLYPKPIFPQIHSDTVKAPLLVTFEASLPLGSDYDWVFAACRGAPLLTRLYTNSFFPNRFPVTQLTTLHVIEPIPIDDIFRLLKDVAGLVELGVDVSGPSAVTFSNGGIVVAKALCKLEITSSQWGHLADIFAQVALPSLTDLVISLIKYWPEDESVLASFLSRSSCMLQRLVFLDVDMTVTQMIRYLEHKACNTLEWVAISEYAYILDHLIEYLTYRQPPFPHPQLKTIELALDGGTPGLLANLAESRILPISGLPEGTTEPGSLTQLHITTAYLETNEYARLHALQNKCEILVVPPP